VATTCFSSTMLTHWLTQSVVLKPGGPNIQKRPNSDSKTGSRSHSRPGQCPIPDIPTTHPWNGLPAPSSSPHQHSNQLRIPRSPCRLQEGRLVTAVPCFPVYNGTQVTAGMHPILLVLIVFTRICEPYLSRCRPEPAVLYTLVTFRLLRYNAVVSLLAIAQRASCTDFQVSLHSHRRRFLPAGRPSVPWYRSVYQYFQVPPQEQATILRLLMKP